jgi:hypothetical protein
MITLGYHRMSDRAESATESLCRVPTPYRRENGFGTARDACFCLAGLTP